MKKIILLSLLAVLSQSAQVVREESRTGHVLYTAKSTATDDGGKLRKVQFVIRTEKDEFTSPKTDSLIRLEVKQETRGSYFDARAEARCGEKTIFTSTRLHGYTEMDAETIGVFTRLTISEAESLAACASPRLSLAGIDVDLTEAQIQPLRAAFNAAKKTK